MHYTFQGNLRAVLKITYCQSFKTAIYIKGEILGLLLLD